MFIKRIDVRGFGRIAGLCDFSEGKCNVLCQDNEYGKSTLVDAILYGFYGLPTKGFGRGDLKPREKYKPWGAGNDSYQVEIEFRDHKDRNLRLTSRFSRPQPFEVIDLDTMEPIPLEGMSFGERFFYMRMSTFTECFFMRQDERANEERGDLIGIIEKAATATVDEEDSSARRALDALAQVKLHLPEFSAGPVTLDNLIKSIDARLRDTSRQIAELEEDRNRREAEIRGAQLLDDQICEHEKRQAQLEYAATAAELSELREQLRRQQQCRDEQESYERRIAELAQYGGVRVEDREKLISLGSDRRVAQQRLENLHQAREEAEQAKLKLQTELGGYPPGFAPLRQEQIERVRSLSASRAGLMKQVEEYIARRDQFAAELAAMNLASEKCEKLAAVSRRMSEDDRRRLLSPGETLHEIEHRLAESEKQAGDARVAVAQAKAKRDKARNMMAVSVMGAVFWIAFGVTMILTNYTTVAILLFLLSAGFFASAWISYTGGDRIQREELDPSVAAEVSSGGECRRLTEELENTRAEHQELLTQYAIEPGEIELIRDSAAWSQSYAGLQAAVRSLAGINDSLDTSGEELVDLLTELGIDEEEAATPEAVNRTITRMTRYIELRSEHERLEKEAAQNQAEIDRARFELKNTERSIAEGLATSGMCVQQGSDADAEIRKFLSMCEKATELRALRSRPPAGDLMPKEQLELVMRNAEQLQAHLADVKERDSSLAGGTPQRPRSEIAAELAAVQHEREELRVRRLHVFNECDRAVEKWRLEGPALHAEKQRLEELKGGIEHFRDAVNLAHDELLQVSKSVFSKWAIALSKRVNEILPLLNPRYRDVRFDEQLEVSVFSTEADRRLEARELHHLSKGARDQIMISVRVAISEYLSSQVGNLPLVFDEPFAHWDDARFVDGMRFLARLAERHQVIVLSCHRTRYALLEHTKPDLFRRLNFCSIEPAEIPVR